MSCVVLACRAGCDDGVMVSCVLCRACPLHHVHDGVDAHVLRVHLMGF